MSRLPEMYLAEDRGYNWVVILSSLAATLLLGIITLFVERL